MLNPDLKEFIELLNSHRVKYLVVGGYALALHGHPRYTKDIDIWILIHPENADNLLRVLEEFGFSELDLERKDFLEQGNVIQLGYLPNRIDIITQATGVDFEECYKSRETIEIDEISVNFIDLDNLKKNKLATGRLQDLADVEKLK